MDIRKPPLSAQQPTFECEALRFPPSGRVT
jgi:hypothetical protein